MNRCSICSDISSSFVSLCSHKEHIVCKKCYETKANYRICKPKPVSDTDNIKLISGSYRYSAISKMIEPYIGSLGIQLPIQKECTIQIDPIKTIIWTEEGCRMNLLQYVILDGEYTHISSENVQTLRIFYQAYYSLLYGLEQGISNIATLYLSDIWDKQIEKDIGNPWDYSLDMVWSRSINMVNRIKQYASKQASLSWIYEQCSYSFPKEYVNHLLSFAIEREWLTREGDIYKYNI